MISDNYFAPVFILFFLPQNLFFLFFKLRYSPGALTIYYCRVSTPDLQVANRELLAASGSANLVSLQAVWPPILNLDFDDHIFL